jgi:hypothetical protein
MEFECGDFVSVIGHNSHLYIAHECQITSVVAHLCEVRTTQRNSVGQLLNSSSRWIYKKYLINLSR